MNKKIMVTVLMIVIICAMSVPAAAEWVWEPFSYGDTQSFDPPITLRLNPEPMQAQISGAASSAIRNMVGPGGRTYVVHTYYSNGSVDFYRITRSLNGYSTDRGSVYAFAQVNSSYSLGWNTYYTTAPYWRPAVSNAFGEFEITSISGSTGTSYFAGFLQERIWVEPPTEPLPTEPPPEPGAENWLFIWEILDMVFGLLWDFRFWGIPVFPAMVAILAVGIVTRVFLITSRSENE